MEMRIPIKLLILHTYYLTLENLRQPMYLVSTFVFPSLFFWFFGIPNAPDADGLAMLTASFCAFAVLSVVLFQFGIGVATDRETSWYSYLRVLPAPRGTQLTARIFSGIVFATLGVLGVLATARFLGDLDFAPYHWGQFLLTLALGAVPFACLGLALGLVVSARSSTPFLNLTYLPLSFAGGLWMPPNILPKVVQDVSVYLPSRHYGELLWATLLGADIAKRDFWGLFAAFSVLLLLLVVLIRREEDQVFR
jgi:ABC-2 type transport system permease protein